MPRELKGTSVPFHYNNLESLDAAIAQLGDNFAAIVMEPMRSQLPQDNFVAKVAERCRAAGAVFAVLKKTQDLNVFDVVVERGTRLQASLRELAIRHPACQLSIGGMPATPSMSFDLGDQSRFAQTLYMRKMQARGFLVMGYHYLRLAHDDEKISDLLIAADESPGEIANIITAGTLAETTGPLVQQIGFARLT